MHGAFSANLDRPARVRFVVVKAGKPQGCLPASFDFGCRGWCSSRQESTETYLISGLLTKSSLEELSRFMCADYDDFVGKCLLLRTFEKNNFQKPDFVNRPISMYVSMRGTRDGGLYTCRRSPKTDRLFVRSRSQNPRQPRQQV